jgi:hypothetical protein
MIQNAAMATPPIPWDKIIQYGPVVAEMASKAWSRAARWREAAKAPAAGGEAAATGNPPDGLADAVAEQATLSREIAEQLKAVSAAVGELSARMARLEVAQEARERQAAEAQARLARRAKLALGLAIAGLVLAGIALGWLAVGVWRVA